jgi:hypothetical protein
MEIQIIEIDTLMKISHTSIIPYLHGSSRYDLDNTILRGGRKT